MTDDGLLLGPDDRLHEPGCPALECGACTCCPAVNGDGPCTCPPGRDGEVRHEAEDLDADPLGLEIENLALDADDRVHDAACPGLRGGECTCCPALNEEGPCNCGRHEEREPTATRSTAWCAGLAAAAVLALIVLGAVLG